MPPVNYFLSTNDTPVTAEDPIWKKALPLSPRMLADPDACDNQSTITYGDYFLSAHRFVEQGHYANLLPAVCRCTQRPVDPREIGTIKITLEKHGQFYHPLRLVLDIDGYPLSFVINGAVTTDGRACLQRDFDNIRSLNRRFPFGFLPQVYSQDTVQLPGRTGAVGMFIGQWLEGFHEFHLSGKPAEGNDRLLVWDPLEGVQRLSDTARCEIYRQATRILTAFYNLETFEHISAWHHAAGDFVVKIDGKSTEVRLITVRKYAPLFTGSSGDADVILQALLVFLLNLSVKMRLDRVDGVGAVAWASDDVVAATVKGFFDGLELQADGGRIPVELRDVFGVYLQSLTSIELDDVFDAMYERTFRQMPESETIGKHLKHHAKVLLKTVGRMGGNPGMTPT